MATRAIYTKLERWFTDVAVQRGLITQEDVHSAIEAQVTSRQQEGRSPHISLRIFIEPWPFRRKSEQTVSGDSWVRF